MIDVCKIPNKCPGCGRHQWCVDSGHASDTSYDKIIEELNDLRREAGTAEYRNGIADAIKLVRRAAR